jgi:hypothetical protein
MKCDMCGLAIRKDARILDGMHSDCALTPDTVALMCVLKDRNRKKKKGKP